MDSVTGVNTVPAVEVSRVLSQGKPVDFIDVRTPVEYAEVHAAGARLVPLDTLDPPAVLASRAGDMVEPLYVICRTGARAVKACEAFRTAGFTNVLAVEGGTAAWEAAGLPVVRGPRTVISLERQVRIAAGALVVLGVVLGSLVHPALYGLAAFVGAGLVFAGLTDTCGMGLLLARMPWNRRAACKASGK